MTEARKNSGPDLMNDNIDVHKFLESLWLNRALIVLCMVGFLCLAGLYVLFKSPIYAADVLLEVQSNNDNISKMNAFMNPGEEGGGMAAELQTVLIRSRFILTPVIQAMNLDLSIAPNYFPLIGKFYARHHNKTLSPPFLGLSHFAWGGESLQLKEFTLPNDDLNRHFTLVALPHQQFALYEDGNYLVTGKIGTQVVGRALDNQSFMIEVSHLVANPNTEFDLLKKPIVDIMRILKSQIAITDLSQENDFSERTGILQLQMLGSDPHFITSLLNNIAQIAVQKDKEKKLTEIAQTTAFLNQQLPLMKQSMDGAQLALNSYLSQHGMIDLNTESKLLVNELIEVQKQLSLLQMSFNGLNQKYTPEHPFVQEARERMRSLEKEQAQLQQKVSQLPTRDQEVMNLMRDVRVKGQLYLTLLNRLQALQMSQASTVSDIRVLNFAEPPQQPMQNKTLLILLGGIVSGFVFGALIVVVRNLLHRKISDIEVLEKDFGLVNMAIVPYSAKQHELIMTHRAKSDIIPLLTHYDSKDLSIEALRSLRTSLKFCMLDAKNNIISITGVAPGIGKSFISANFAYLLAEAGKRILLIDGDIRKGHLRKYFRPEQMKGLSEVIGGTAAFEDVVVHKYPQLDFLACGQYPSNPSEILMSESFNTFLEKISLQYDLVLIDTPPILAVTDAAIIGHQVGANFIVIAADCHDHAEIELAMKRFAANHIKMNGMIFNFVKEDTRLYRRVRSHKYKKYQYKYE